MIIKGIVKNLYVQEKEKSITILISEKAAKTIAEISDDITIQYDEEKGYSLRAHTSFDIALFQNGEPFELGGKDAPIEKFTDIGTGSEVILSVNFKDGKYKGKKYTTCYLSALNILSLEEAVPYNPFLDVDGDEGMIE